MTAKIKLNAASGGGSVSLKAPSTTTSNAAVELQLPVADGSDGQAIVTDGSGNLSFGSVAATRNLIINGAMQVAQRNTSATVASNGYWTVDRFTHVTQGNDEQPTSAQVDVASGTTPYTLGFRKALKITNGNQTSGAGTSDRVRFGQNIEAQDIANSGWNYTSASSFITLSCWVKSSVAQNFYFNVKSHDGTQQNFPFETGSLTADTWTKITKTISGNSNLQFDNNTSTGFELRFNLFLGTDFTANGTSLDTWAAYASGTHCPDFTSTWYTTNDATFEMTGLQIEVSSISTDFEHRSFGQELALCQRYFYLHANATEASGGDNEVNIGQSCYYGSPDLFTTVHFPVRMRTTPSLVQTTGTDYYVTYRTNAADVDDNVGVINRASTNACTLYDSSASGSPGDAAFLNTYKAAARVSFSAEL